MNTITHTTCRVCGSQNLTLLVDYGDIPLAGGFLAPEDRHLSTSYPLRLAVCQECTLMQVMDTVPPDMIFRQYSYASSTTRTLVDHFAQMAQDIVKTRAAAGKLVVEFGCNDGILLRPLREAGANVVGVDPSDVALRASQEQGWSLINDYFTEVTAAQVRDVHGQARIITANNTFAHTDDLHTIMRGVAALLEAEGYFIFEVQYQGELIRLAQYDTVYHEHVCYHSLTSLAHLLHLHGFKIINVLPIPIHSGSIRVTAARTAAPVQPAPIVADMLAGEKSWNLDRFAEQVAARRATLKYLVEDLRQSGKRVVAYGAAGRVTVLLNYCGLDASLVEYVVDMSPLRYGRLVPGQLVPIVPVEVFHENPPDYAIMTAWNYEAEIVYKEQKFLQGRGRFIIPLPDVRIVGRV